MPILPILAAYLLFRRLRRDRPWTDAVLQAAVVWAVWLFCLTELLSAVHAIGFAGIAGGWLLVVAVLVVTLRRLPRASVPVFAPEPPPRWVAIPIALTLTATLVIGVVAAPNSTDSMTYHLARVTQWIQRQSVDPYATSTLRQIYMPPWAEYAVLHFQVLAGGSDRFAALVQWLAFAGCLVVTDGIARQLGATGQERALALLFTATIPMLVVQASSTQVDLVVAFWCAVFAWSVLPAVREREGPGAILFPACALGLAIGTKGTAYVFAAPFAVWWLVDRLRKGGWRRATVEAARLGAVVVLLNAPVFARNVRLFGHPLGPRDQRAALANASHGPGALASNIIRNATLHLSTPDEAWNARLAAGVERLHRLVGLDPSDPRTTWHENAFDVRPLRTKESRTGNPLHFVLAGIALGVVWLRPSPPLQRRYALALVAGAVLFCWIFRWQQWHSRLHPPLFVLAGPLVAVALGPRLGDRAKAALGLGLWVAALPWVVSNESRPLVQIRRFTQTPSIFTQPREHQYFVEDTGIEAPYRRLIADLRGNGCGVLGVAGGDKTGIYLLVPLARARGLRLTMSYVGVENETQVLERFVPACAILVEEHPPDWRPGPPHDRFTLVWRDERAALWADPDFVGSSPTIPSP